MLIGQNNSVATDTTTGEVIGTILEKDKTNSSGYVVLYLPKSYIYHDSLKSLFDFSLTYAGRTVKTWPKFYIPNQDTVRLTVEN